MHSMLSESAAGNSRQLAGGHAFWWRMTDNLFRRLVWFVLPIVAMTVLGISQANKTVEVYQASGQLSASTNPLVPDQQVSGMTSQLFESPAGATSRIINERLRTDSFLTKVAAAAGLGASIESGLLDLNVIRSTVWASANGDSILSVNARTSNPQLSYALVTATIAEFQSFVTETAASDSTEAEAFWSQRLESLEAERQQAQAALTEFVDQLPPLAEGEERAVQDELELGRLSDRVSSLDSKVDDATAELDRAQLLRTQQSTEAVRRVTVIDEPRVPGAPESTLMKRVTLVGSFFLLGVVIAAAALLVTTVLDQSVASSADLLAITGIALVATVPPVRFADARPVGRSLIPRRLRQRGTTQSGGQS
jgi:uncharacterized protein involved in exopolysaccharide biosynthesis